MTSLKTKTTSPFLYKETTSPHQDSTGNAQKRTFTFSDNGLYGVRDFSYLDRPVSVATHHPAHHPHHIFFHFEEVSMEWRLKLQADIHPSFLIYRLSVDSVDEEQLENWIDDVFPEARDARVVSYEVEDELWLGVGTLFRLSDRYPKPEFIAILEAYEIAYQSNLSAKFYQTLERIWELPVDAILEKIAYGDLDIEANELDVLVTCLNGCPLPYLFHHLID